MFIVTEYAALTDHCPRMTQIESTTRMQLICQGTFTSNNKISIAISSLVPSDMFTKR